MRFRVLHGRRLLAVCIAAIAAVSGSLALRPASAAVIDAGLEYTTVENSSGPWGGSLGYAFTALDDITVVLGVWTDGGSVGGPVDVGLWDAAGNLLLSTQVVSTDPVDGHFQYDDGASISLTSGNTYIVGSPWFYAWWNNPGAHGVVFDPRISFVESRYANFGDGFVYPGLVDPGADFGFAAGTVGIIDQAAVPEPASMTIFGVGLLGLAWRVRRRRAAK